MHALVVGQGWIGAAEFWTLPPGQIWWVIDDRLPQGAAGALSDRAEMLTLLRKAKRDERSA
ncbi:hypothetical protein [Xinfangfangia pollutisoli]|uniref:hypothetical protein n=1 Tax=Xinfangfangia pollutisoli TaxID=2865960 RepID=UPI001CD53937|nr:hypothetical protein [Xinfangfangia pollutisoli]